MANERLPYILDFQNGSVVNAILKKAQQLPTNSQLEQILGSKANLDSDGLIPVSEIPPMAMEHMKLVQTTADMYNLTIDDVQNGDTVFVNETKVMYLVIDETKLDQAAGYKEYAAGTASRAIADKNGNDITTTYQTKIDRLIMDPTENAILYIQATQPSGTIPEGSIWINTAVSNP